MTELWVADGHAVGLAAAPMPLFYCPTGDDAQAAAGALNALQTSLEEAQRENVSLESAYSAEFDRASLMVKKAEEHWQRATDLQRQYVPNLKATLFVTAAENQARILELEMEVAALQTSLEEAQRENQVLRESRGQCIRDGKAAGLRAVDLQRQLETAQASVRDYMAKYSGILEALRVSQAEPKRCPVCGGTGRVQEGFYSSTTGSWSSNATGSEQCQSCSGAGYVPNLKATLRVAEALRVKLHEIHEDERYKSVWVMAANRGQEYSGPTYTAELAALDALTPQDGKAVS